MSGDQAKSQASEIDKALDLLLSEIEKTENEVARLHARLERVSRPVMPQVTQQAPGRVETEPDPVLSPVACELGIMTVRLRDLRLTVCDRIERLGV